jgi:ATP-binding cassette subfamily B protein
MLPIPLLAYFTYRYVGIYQPKYAIVRARLADLLSRLENNLGGIRVIKASTAEGYERARVTEASDGYHDTYWDAIVVSTTFFPILRVVAGTGFVLTFVAGGLWVFFGPPLWFTGTLTVGTFVTFILLTQQFVWPMAEFGEIVNLYQRAKASAQRVFDLADEPARVPERPDAPALVVDGGTVEYDHVSFGYGDEPVLRDVSFVVPAGTTLGLVGATGAGKSTVVELFMRLYDVDDGAIRIDGQDLRDVTLESLRGSIGYVSQDSYLFHGTVRENIAYARPEATAAEVEEAARRAHAHRFIENLPNGYDTMVGERGVKLSGGQRQRVAIARAILADPAILVFDEATSAVDTETELLIQRSLADLTADRTTIVIAHRLSTVRHAENIVVLEDGGVVERGTHDDLLAEDGLYAGLWAVQAGVIDDLPPEFVARAADRAARVEGD